MGNPSKLKVELVELVYDLLSEQRAAELRLRIANEPETAELYEQVKREANIIANASRCVVEKSLFDDILPQSDESDMVDDRTTEITMPAVVAMGISRTVHAEHDRPHMFRLMPWEFAKQAFLQERNVNRIMSCAAICLVVVTISGFLYQRYRVAQVGEMPLRIVAAAPQQLVKGTPQSLQVQVSDLLGEQRQAPVRVTLNGEHGAELAAVAGETASDGKLLLSLAELTDQVDAGTDTPLQLEISAGTQPTEKYAMPVRLLEAPKPPPVDYHAELAANNRMLNAENSRRVIARANRERPSYSAPSPVYETQPTPQTPALMPQQQAEMQNSPENVLPYRNSQMASNPSLYFPNQTQLYIMPQRPASEPVASMAKPEESKQEEVPSFVSNTPSELPNSTLLSRMAPSSSTSSDRSADVPSADHYSAVDTEDNKKNANGQDSRQRRMAGGRAVYDSLADADTSQELGDHRFLGSTGQMRTRQGMAAREQRGTENTELAEVNKDTSDSSESVAESMNSGYSDGMSGGYGGEGMGAGSGGYGGGGMGGLGMSGMSSPSPLGGRPNVQMPLVPDIALLAEGGRLVAGLQNRVFFRVTVGAEPIRQLTGNVVDDLGQKTAKLECAVDSFGQFYFEPQPDRQYRLVIDRWETVSRQSNDMPPFETAVTLPKSDSPVGMGLAKHVISTDESPTVHVRSRRSNVPVVVTASQRGVVLLSESVVANEGVTSVRLPLPKSVVGPVDIAVFDAQSEPFALFGMEQCLRRPAQWLTITATQTSQNDSKSRQVELLVSDADGKPVPNAALSVRVLRDVSAGTISPDSFFATVPSETGLRNFAFGNALADRLIDWATLENLLTSNDAAATQTLDFLVATGTLPFNGGKEPEQIATHELTPVVMDNLAALQAGYDQKIESFRRSQQAWGHNIGLFVIFGGMALAVLSMIFVIMRLASGSRMFVVATVSGLTCVFVCMVMLRGNGDGRGVAILSKHDAAASFDLCVAEMPSSEQIHNAEKFRDGFAYFSTMAEETEIGESKTSRQQPADSSTVHTATYPLTIEYENTSLCTDSDGRAVFEMPLPDDISVAPVLYLIVEAESQNGFQGLLRAMQPSETPEM